MSVCQKRLSKSNVSESVLYHDREEKPRLKVAVILESNILLLDPVGPQEDQPPPYEQPSADLSEISRNSNVLDAPPPYSLYSPTPLLQTESTGHCRNDSTSKPLRCQPTRSSALTSRFSLSPPRAASSTSENLAAAERPTKGADLALRAARVAFAMHQPNKSKAATAPPPKLPREPPRTRVTSPQPHTHSLTNLAHPFAPQRSKIPLHRDRTHACQGVKMPGAWPLT